MATLAALAWACGDDVPKPGSDLEPAAIRAAKVAATQQALVAMDSRVDRLLVYPGDISVEVGQEVQPLAVALDRAGNSLYGIEFTWSAKRDRGGRVQLDETGRFAPDAAGLYTLTVRGPKGTSASMQVTATAPGGIIRAATVNAPGDPSYDPDVARAVFRPVNQRRVKPNEPVAAAALKTTVVASAATESVPGSVGEYTFDVPLLATPARGIGAGLTLHYSAKVWTMTDTSAEFDADGDWPAPGFTLSYGKLILTSSDILFIDSTGTRHGLRSGAALAPSRTYTGYASDGSLLAYEVRTDGSAKYLSGKVWYPDGTRLDFGAAGAGGAAYVTRMTDSNGNYVIPTYVNNAGPKLLAVTDTLGRTYNFNADSTTGNLTSVTGPGLADAAGNSTTRTLARLHYALKRISTSFAVQVPPLVNGGDASGQRWLLDAVVFGDGTGYSMGAGGVNYSPYGMARQYEQRVEMAIDAAGNVRQGTLRAYTYYDYPATDSNLTTTPKYSQQTSYWTGTDLPGAGTAVTTYASSSAAGVTTTTVTNPDGSKVVRASNGSTGLTISVSFYGADGRTLRTTSYTYTTVFNASTVTEEVTEDFGAGTSAPRRTVYVYRGGTGQAASQLLEIQQYDFNRTTLLRKTAFQYVTDPAYETNHVLNLVTRKLVYDGVGTLLERTDVAYDSQRGQALVNPQGNTTPLSSQFRHDGRTDPYLTTNCQGPCYDPATDFRGNVSSATRYAAAAAGSGGLTSTLTYDMLGNVVTSVAENGVQVRITYSRESNYGYPVSKVTGSGTTTVSTGATYDIATGLVTSSTAETGRSTAFEYRDTSRPDLLRLRRVTYPTGARNEFIYYDGSFLVDAVTYSGSNALTSEVLLQQNGLGADRQRTVVADIYGTADVVDTQYDGLGRVVRQSLPHRDFDPPKFATNAYDGLGRLTSRTAPDGVSVATWEYQPSFVAPGQPSVGLAVLETSEWGAQRWLQSNALGQLTVSYEAKNTAGPTASVTAGGILSTYTYDVLDNVLTASVAGRTHRFVYDGLSRVVAQRLAERNATLDSTGRYRGAAAGAYSDVFVYDAQGRLLRATDARSIITNYDYGTDALSRLQSISYNTTFFGDTAHPVTPAGRVEYVYCTAGSADCPHNDVRLPTVERTVDTSATVLTSKGFKYDAYGRTLSVTASLGDRPSTPFVVGYGYDSLNRLTSTTYPTEWGLSRPTRKVAVATLDPRGRPTALTFGTTAPPTYAQNITYDATGGMQQALIGFAGGYQATETWAYEAVSGLLQRQRVVPQGSATPTMDLTYGYLTAIPAGSSTYKRNGQLTSMTNAVNGTRGRSYTYDSLGRLYQASNSNYAWTQTYAYDDAGNRTQAQVAGAAPVDGLTQALTFDTQNRISGFEYDDAGNLVQGKVDDGTTERFQYDAAGRLVNVSRVTTTQTLLETYTYGTGRERWKVKDAAANVQTYYARSGGAVLAEYNEAAGTTTPVSSKQYVYLQGRLLAALRPSGATDTVEWYHSDRLGVRLIATSTTGTKEQVTLPFGTALDSESTGSTNYRFTSYDRSSVTKLDYAVNRYYSSALGRFSQVDPLGPGATSLGSSQSLNLYAYAGNDPVNGVDPSGLRPDSLVKIWEFINNGGGWAWAGTNDNGSSKGGNNAGAGGSGGGAGAGGGGAGAGAGGGGGGGAGAGGGQATSCNLGEPGCNYPYHQTPGAGVNMLPGSPSGGGRGSTGGTGGSGSDGLKRAELPKDANSCVGMGRQWYAPQDWTVSSVIALGQVDGINPAAWARAASQFGSLDTQRVGRPESFNFYPDYIHVSNMNVGIYLYGAGLGPFQAGVVSNAYALGKSSNFGDGTQADWRNFGYRLASTHADYTCVSAFGP